MTGVEMLLVPLLVKYAVNGLNALEDWLKREIPNWVKQGAVIVLSWAAAHVPFLQAFLPRNLDPNAQAAIVSIATTLLHHGIELLLAVINRVKAPK